jgi:glucokinase
MVIDAAKAGDPFANAIVNAYVDDIGSYLASVINLLDPERIAIGGGVSAAGEFIMKPIRENVQKKTFFDQPTDIVVATAGNDAGIFGAAFIAE